MKRFLFLVIGIMMVGGIAVAEAGPPIAENVEVEAIVPTESTVVVPAIEKPAEVAFDVEGVEIDTNEGLNSVSGDGGGFISYVARTIRDVFLGGVADGIVEQATGKGLWERGQEVGRTITKAATKGYQTYCDTVYSNNYKNVRGWLADR